MSKPGSGTAGPDGHSPAKLEPERDLGTLGGEAAKPSVEESFRRVQPGAHRLSPRYVPLNALRSFKQGFVVVAAIVVNIAVQRENIPFDIPLVPLVAAMFLLWVILAFAVYFIGYKRFSWEITDNELHIFKGLISRSRLHVPYERIHSSDIHASLLDRIFGVVTLKMDTAGSGRKGADVKVPALERHVAESIKNEIFLRKKMVEGAADSKVGISEGLNAEADMISRDMGAYFGESGAESGKAVSDASGAYYRLSFKELVLSGISEERALLLIFIAISAITQFINMLGNTGSELWAAIGYAANLLLERGALAVIGVVLAIILVTMVFSVAGKMLKLWNFTVKREGGSIALTRGLLEKNSEQIAVDRIQAVKIRQGIIRRIMGYAEITVERVMHQNDMQENKKGRTDANQIHPFIKMSKADEFLEAILPEFAYAPKEAALTRLGRAALRRSVFRYGRWALIFWVLPIAVAVTLIGTFAAPVWEGAGILQTWLIIGGAVIFCYLLVTSFFAYRGRAVGYNDKMLTMKNGAYVRRYVYMPRRKIQYAVKAQNPFQRWSRVATITARSASPTMPYVSAVDVDDSYADDWLEWVESDKPV